MNTKKALLIFGFFINIVMFALGIFGLFISSQNNKVLCKYNGKLVKGSVYTDEKYTYKYMQEAIITSDGTSWKDIDEDGWGVLLIDMQSTDPVIDSPCSSINNKPIVSMSSFNFRSYVSLNYIFRSSFIKTVYVNNQDDIDVLNSFDISKPSWLKFEIKNKQNG